MTTYLLDAAERRGETPLVFPVAKGNVALAEMLLDAGADEGAKNVDGVALVALKSPNPNMVGLFQRVLGQREARRVARGTPCTLHPAP